MDSMKCRVAFMGDYVPENRIKKMVENKNYSFFNEVRDELTKYDFSFLNLECSLYNAEKKIKKTGRHIIAPPNTLESLAYLGIGGVLVANNHFNDSGAKGIKESLSMIQNTDLLYGGAGLDEEDAKKIIYIEASDVVVAIVSACSREFVYNMKDGSQCNALHAFEVAQLVMEAKSKADFVVVSMHSGVEHYRFPTPLMKKKFRHYVDMGADAVINHHQHCISGYEVYKNVPIFYGVGNFCFDSPNRMDAWYHGLMVGLTFEKGKKVEFTYRSFSQGLEVPDVRFDKKPVDLRSLNEIIADDKALIEQMDAFVLTHKKHLLAAFEPYSERYMMAAYRRNLLPSILSGKKLRQIHNSVRCENHNELVIRLLDHLNSGGQ